MIVVHGGAGLPGSVGALAQALATPARVLEPWQTATTIAEHIADLRSFITAHCPAPPILVGHSWGAMLSLAFAAEHPTRALCLVGGGTWNLESRAELVATERRGLPPGADQLPPAERFGLIDKLYFVDPLPQDPLDDSEFDEATCTSTWNDMLRLQADGTYPAAFARIRVPVLMIHGADDPHPGRSIRASLLPFLPQLEYRELARCGHYPWRERHARDEFLAITRDWLVANR